MRASGVELDLAVRSAETPVLLVHGLAVVTGAVGLPGLVVGLEVEQIDAPGEHAADAGLPEGLGVVGAGLGGFVVGATVCDLLVGGYRVDRGSCESYQWASQSRQ